MHGAHIVGIGTALPGTDVPGRIVTNAMLADELLSRRQHLVDNGLLLPPERWAELDEQRRTEVQIRWEQFETGGAWIEDHTGILERREAAPNIATSDLAIHAGRQAMAVAGWAAEDVEFLLVATVWPDHIATPPTAALVQAGLGLPTRNEDGLRDIDGLDVACACSSFLKALKIGWAYCASGLFRRGLVIGADVMTRTVNRYDRAILPILADGGGALALEGTADDAFLGPAGFTSGLDGSLADLIITPIGGTREPLVDSQVVADPFHQRHRMTMLGPKVKRAVDRLLLPRNADDPAQWGHGVLTRALLKAGLSLQDIDLFALHQANLRMNAPVEEKLRRMGYRGAMFHNIMRYGNTTSASIPLLLADAWREGVLRQSHTVMAAVFGGGFSWETATFRWTLPNP